MTSTSRDELISILTADLGTASYQLVRVNTLIAAIRNDTSTPTTVEISEQLDRSFNVIQEGLRAGVYQSVRDFMAEEFAKAEERKEQEK